MLARLIDGIADEVERRFKRYPGFVSASFHASDYEGDLLPLGLDQVPAHWYGVRWAGVV